MVCPHCLTSYHESLSSLDLKTDKEFYWRVAWQQCPACLKFVIFLKRFHTGNPNVFEGEQLVYPKAIARKPLPPGRPMAASCRVAAREIIVGRAKATHGPHDLPHSDCTCGVYAAKNMEHLRQFGYEGRSIHGEVYLWGTVVEHKLGWRAQFAYPKSLFLPPDAIPFTLSEIDSRLRALIAFGADIFIMGDHESVRFWKNGSGFDEAGLDYLIKTRTEYYVRRQQERTLKKGDRVAVLGQGIAVVERVDEGEAVVILGNRLVLRIPRKYIVLNQHNRRWEYAAR